MNPINKIIRLYNKYKDEVSTIDPAYREFINVVGNSKLKSNDRSIVNFENKPYDYYYYKKYKAYTMYDKTSEIVFSFIWIGDRYKDVRSYDDGIDLLKKLNIELKKFNERLKREVNYEYRKTNK